MPAPDAVLKLCETFADHSDQFRSGNYNEAQLRKEFLDPFFAALGWDMDNTQGLAPQYRDVIHEDALRVGLHVKAPDYAFTLHGQRKFFLEAKKPVVNLKSDVDPAYQLRRYAWSAKMPLSVLSDFEEFAIYDTRVKPVRNDPAAKARTFYCTHEQFPEKWDEIAAIFSRDAILKGSFDKYADSNKKKKGTAEVDAAFLEEIERWRDLLARNLALRNPALSVRDLNFAVQKTIDRLVFLRICEDRGTEDYGRLRTVANGTQTYPRLLELFRNADHRYNSGLFHFSREKGQAEEPDTLTPHLALDDKVLKDIITHLYYPDSPYEFSVLPADILGSVYEQFLGKVITLTAGHRAVVEDKPEVKKAGGVFYTPTYIVDYIVRQTVGPLIEGKTPKQIESVHILDPACGSGSFLIVAYQFLLDWYHQYHISHDPEKLAKGKNPLLVPARGGGWALTTAESKRILLTHIFGVDIDSQAVEVTKLSLLLKVLEGETAHSVQLELIHQRVLPDLGDNIKCGNSLIASDFYAQPGLPAMDADAHLRVNVFDWDGKDGFPEIMHAGGFDAVIGNPPYLAGREWNEVLWQQRDYFHSHFSCMTDQYDLYALFIQRAHLLLKERGGLGFITPNTWLNNEHYLGLRQWMVQNADIDRIGDFRDVKVFPTATVLPIVLIANRSSNPTVNNDCIIETFKSPVESTQFETSVEIWNSFPNLVFNLSLSKSDLPILKKLERSHSCIGDIADVRFGVKVYQTGKGKPAQTGAEAKAKSFESATKDGADYLPYLWGQHVSRWGFTSGHAWLRYGKHLAEPRTIALFEGPRVLVRRIVGDRLVICPVIDSMIADQLLHTVKVTAPDVDHRFTAALLGSRVVAYYFRKRFNRTEKTFPEIRVAELSAMPLPFRSPANKTDLAAHDRIVSLVEHMMDLHRQRAAVKTPHEQTALDRQIAATDTRIDCLVYDLYGLTEEEIKLVEGA
ncbi:MAG: N-6 DNA methylase [Verrucomicrobia bacterium]|nr:N-6 DNA methylase [Verrucomicrobiota bacterium]